MATGSDPGRGSRSRRRSGSRVHSVGVMAGRQERGQERSMTHPISRVNLPIPDEAFHGSLPYDAKDPRATFAPIEPLRPPAGAPNVLIILIDDAGFGASSAFGGPCQ